MKLAIDETRCKGCNLCTKVCPYKIFREGKKPNRKGIVVPETGPARALRQLPAPEPLRPAALRRLPAHLPGPGNPLDRGRTVRTPEGGD